MKEIAVGDAIFIVTDHGEFNGTVSRFMVSKMGLKVVIRIGTADFAFKGVDLLDVIVTKGERK